MLQLSESPVVDRNLNESLGYKSISAINLSNSSNVTGDSNFNGSFVDSDRSPVGFLTAEIIGNFIAFYYPPILVSTGGIGNILSVFVFFKTKLRKLSSSYYLAALAVSDTCFLLCLIMQWVKFMDIFVYNYEIFCQGFTFLTYLSSFLSVWFVVAFTVERFIAVMYPLKRQSMCTVKRAKMVLCGLTILGCIHCIPVLYITSPVIPPDLNATVCGMRPLYKQHMIIYNYVDTVVVFVVPLTAIAVLNTFTGCTVWKFATVRRTMTTHKRKAQTPRTFSPNGSTRNNLRKQSTLSSGCTHPNGNNSITHTGSSKSNRRKMTNSSQIKVTKMLLIVSTVFVCLNLPSYVMRVIVFLEITILFVIIRVIINFLHVFYFVILPNKAHRGEDEKKTLVTQYICWFFFITNFGINFVLYCVSGQNFRRAVISVFRKVSSSNLREGTTQVTVSEYIRNSGTNVSRRRTCNQNGSWNDVHELRQIISVK